MADIDLFIQADDGETRQERLRIENGVVSVGRHAANDVCLESDLVSRHHARIELMEDGLRIEDASSNGTLAGDVLLRKEVLDVPYGTPIKVGNFTLQIDPARVSALRAPMPPPRRAPRPTAPTIPPPPTIAAPPMGPPKVPPRAQPPRAPAIPAIPAIPPVAASTINETEDANVDLRREIHKMLLENLDLASMDPSKLDDPSMRPRVLTALRRIVKTLDARMPATVDRDALVGELADEALGLGPLERFLADPAVNEIMVVDPSTIYVEIGGKLIKTEARFTDDERVRAVIERIVTPLGRRIDESSPLVDARLKDGSRVNAVIRPIALRGSCITIRKFSAKPLTLDKLISYGTLTEQMARFLTRSVIAKKNVVISGGTGSGKTTLLNVLSGAIPEGERIVTIEDAAELQLKQPHVVSLETRPANMEGRGEFTIRDLVKNALRMRPDRIVVGECRGGEALDMLQAMNTGHDGSLTTTHANSPAEALARIETLVLMAGVDLPSRAIREQIAGSIHLVVQVSRMSDGTRKVTSVSEVIGIDDDGTIEEHAIFHFVRTGTDAAGKVLGEYRATGYLPSFLDQFIVMGFVKRGEPYLLTPVVIGAQALKWGGAALVVVGAMVATWAVVDDPQGVPRRYWARYVVFLERKLRRMFLWTSGQTIAVTQVLGVLALFALWIVIDLPLWHLAALAVIFGPAWWIERMRQKRVQAIEEQIDGFVMSLANALKATPSIGDAIRSIATLIREPLRQEVELAVKEMRVGATLDQALLLMANRVGSRQLDAALSAVLIGRQVGGNLPRVLEQTALSLREMARLEGVVRTKTAEGKMQMWVLAVFPLVMIFALSSVSPGYFDPLTESVAGYCVVVLAVLFWFSSLVVARKILAVDI